MSARARRGAARAKVVNGISVARREPDRIIEDVLTYQRLRRYARFAFESNQFQSFLADELTRRSNAAGLYLPVEPVVHTTDKLGRIQSLQPLVRSGTLQFSRRHILLLEQLRLFPKAAHDDGPDALEMAVVAARNASAYRWDRSDFLSVPTTWGRRSDGFL